MSGEIVVFAASSLTDAFQELAQAFMAANPGTRVSADQAQMDSARKANAIVGSDRAFARNRLVLIVPKDNPRQVSGLKDLAREGLKFVTAQPSVPIGQYTAQLLGKAAADPAYGADFKDRVQRNTVSQEDNVRQVVSKVQLGEADAAVVYATDVTPQVRDQLQLIQVPDALQTIAVYPIVVTKGGNAAGGEAYSNFVLSPAGQAILARWGFLSGTP
jgi:molybdate transport system substrate-binding protein